MSTSILCSLTQSFYIAFVTNGAFIQLITKYNDKKIQTNKKQLKQG